MSALRALAWAVLGMASVRAQTLSADEIMQRVAANQDRAQELRSAYVYQQKLLIKTLDSHGKLRREEASEYIVTPGPAGTEKQRTSVAGKYLEKGRYVEFKETGPEEESSHPGVRRDTADADIIRGLGKDLTGDGKSRDGINRELFPLTTEQIAQYTFELKGEENWRGMRVYRVGFAPREKHGVNVDTAEGPWAGDAVVSAEDFQPVEVTTKLAHKIPGAVRILLGTNVRGLGFNVRYEKVDGGVWFPVSYGTEFSIRVLFGWARTITMSLGNSGFRKADVKSTVVFDSVDYRP